MAIIGALLVGTPVSLVYAQEGLSVDKFERVVTAASTESNAIPDWVKSQFEWYVNEEIDEKTLLTSMNWMFDNNVMHLSQDAAQEVHDLRAKIAEQEAAISSLRTLVSSQGMSDESGEYWIEDLQPGYSENTSGERIMQPEFGADDSTTSKVIVRGWDPEQMSQDRMDSWKNEVMHGVGTTNESDPDDIDRVKVKFPWLPEGLEGDPDRPIIVGGVSSSDSHGVFIMDKNDESARLFLKILESKLQEEIMQSEADQETLRNDRQLASSQFENANQKATQYINMLSSVLKTINEMNQGIIRNIG